MNKHLNITLLLGIFSFSCLTGNAVFFQSRTNSNNKIGGDPVAPELQVENEWTTTDSSASLDFKVSNWGVKPNGESYKADDFNKEKSTVSFTIYESGPTYKGYANHPFDNNDWKIIQRSKNEFTLKIDDLNSNTTYYGIHATAYSNNVKTEELDIVFPDDNDSFETTNITHENEVLPTVELTTAGDLSSEWYYRNYPYFGATASIVLHVDNWGKKSDGEPYKPSDFYASASTLSYGDINDPEVIPNTDWSITSIGFDQNYYMLTIDNLTIGDTYENPNLELSFKGHNSLFYSDLDVLELSLPTIYPTYNHKNEEQPTLIFGAESFNVDKNQVSFDFEVTDWGNDHNNQAYTEEDFDAGQQYDKITYVDENGAEQELTSWQITPVESKKGTDQYLLTVNDLNKNTSYDDIKAFLVLDGGHGTDSAVTDFDTYDYLSDDTTVYNVTTTGMSTWAITGIVIGSVVIIVLIGLGSFYFYNKNKESKNIEVEDKETENKESEDKETENI